MREADQEISVEQPLAVVAEPEYEYGAEAFEAHIEKQGGVGYFEQTVDFIVGIVDDVDSSIAAVSLDTEM